MKKYIALKKVHFDRSYKIGEEISKDVIAQNMVSKLVRCGVIAAVAGKNNAQSEQDSVKENDEQNNSSEEKDSLENKQQKNTEKELLQKKKEELIQITKQMGLETTETMTKAEITALIIQKGKGYYEKDI